MTTSASSIRPSPAAPGARAPSAATCRVAPELTPSSPFIRRFAAWASDRFPPAVGLLAAALFFDAVLIGSMDAGSRPLQVGAADLAGFVAFWSYLLALRIYDEHKDAEADRLAHPERLTVTGVMPLAQLRWVLVAALLYQGAVSLWFDRGVGAVTIAWLAATAWSLLMLREFFVPGWLRSHPVLYALSHSVAMPLMVLWAVEMGTHGPVRPLSAAARTGILGSWVTWSFATLALAASLLFELSRKMRAPEDERDLVDSYSRLLGTGRSAAIGCLLVGIMVTATLGISTTAGGTSAALATVLAAGCAPFALFARRPTRRRATTIEVASGLGSLALLVAVAVTLCMHGGLTWA